MKNAVGLVEDAREKPGAVPIGFGEDVARPRESPPASRSLSVITRPNFSTLRRM